MQNLLLVTVDSLRADHVGWHGYERETTPNLDALAAESHRFENAFAHACSTRPSFPTILTSSYSLMYGGVEQLSTERTLVSEVLQEAGYRTGGFHSNGYLGADFGYDRGWERFVEWDADTSTMGRIKQFVKDGLDEDGRLYQLLADAVDTAERHTGRNAGSAYVSADRLTDLALEWVEETAGDPSFLWVHYMDVHHPYVPPAEHQRAFRDRAVDRPRAIKLRRKMIESPSDVTDDELDALLDLYDAEIRYTDSEIGRLVENVRDAWQGDTLVAVTADHGEEFREHGRFSHHATFHDELVHVPLVLQDGSGEATHEEMVGLLDLAPTLVDYGGGSIPENMYGHSLRPLVETGEWPREAVLGDWESEPGGERRFYYRDHDWKYIRRASTEELYDLQSDPAETENVADREPAVLTRLREAVDAHVETVESTETEVESVEMDEDVRRRLQELGYRE